MTAAIELRDVSKSFGEKQIMKHVTLCLEAGKCYGFQGENGCGKSVLFKCICGLVACDGGEIRVLGKRVTTRGSHAGQIGALIEAPAYLPRFSGIRNLMMLSSIQGRITRQDVEKAMEKVLLDPKERKRVGSYSLGMRQKLAIAAAIMEHPPILILDEPFNALDAESIRVVEALLREEKQKGTTILLTDHRKTMLDKLCDEVFHFPLI